MHIALEERLIEESRHCFQKWFGSHKKFWMISSYTQPNIHQTNPIIHLDLDKNRKVFHSLSLLFCISSFFFAVSVLRVIMSLNSRKLSWPFPAWSNFLNVASIWNVTSTWFYILFMIQNGEMVAALYMKYSLYSIFTTIWYLGKKEGTRMYQIIQLCIRKIFYLVFAEIFANFFELLEKQNADKF